MPVLPSRRLDRGRRELLLRLARGTTAFGVGAAVAPAVARAQVDEAAKQRDIGSLLSQVWMEDVAVALYRVAAQDLLSPELAPVAEMFGEHHTRHAEQAKEELRSLGASVPIYALQPADKVPPLEGDEQVLRYALSLETMAVDAYTGLAALLSTRELRAHAAQVLGGEVGHVITLRAALWDADYVRAADFAFTTELSPYVGGAPWDEE